MFPLAERSRSQRQQARPDAPAFSLDCLSSGLRRRELSFQGTRRSLKKKRPPVRFEVTRDNLTRCRAAAREGKPGLFYLDESGFANIPNGQRAWSPKGQPHAADDSVSRQWVSVVGALDWADGTLWHDLHTGKVRRDAVAALIDRIARREERAPLTLVVLDNATLHHGISQEQLDEWMIDYQLILVHLPPYSPELKPIEIVWKQAKYHLRRFATWSKEQLLEEVQKLMEGVGSEFEISFS